MRGSNALQKFLLASDPNNKTNEVSENSFFLRTTPYRFHPSNPRIWIFVSHAVFFLLTFSRTNKKKTNRKRNGRIRMRSLSGQKRSCGRSRWHCNPWPTFSGSWPVRTAHSPSINSLTLLPSSTRFRSPISTVGGSSVRLQSARWRWRTTRR